MTTLDTRSLSELATDQVDQIQGPQNLNETTSLSALRDEAMSAYRDSEWRSERDSSNGDKNGQTQDEKKKTPENAPDSKPTVDPELAKEMERYRAEVARLKELGIQVKILPTVGEGDGSSMLHVGPDVDPAQVEFWKGNINYFYSHLTGSILRAGQVGVNFLTPGALTENGAQVKDAEEEAQRRAADPKSKDAPPIEVSIPAASVRFELEKDKDGKLQISIVGYDWANAEHPEICRVTIPFESAINGGADGPFFDAIKKFVSELGGKSPYKLENEQSLG